MRKEILPTAAATLASEMGSIGFHLSMKAARYLADGNSQASEEAPWRIRLP